MNQSFNPVFELDESTEIGDIGNGSVNMVVNHQFSTDILPGIFIELFNAEGETLISGIKV